MKIAIPSCFSLSIDDRRWFVLRVRAGMEDDVFAKLTALGYDAYLPRRRYDQQNRRMRVWVERNVPALPGYLFLVHPRKGGTVDDWTELTGNGDSRGINGALGPLGSHDGPLRVPGRIIEAVLADEFGSVYDETAAGKRARGENDRTRLERRFPVGADFSITEGPFSGFMTKVDELTHDDRVKGLVDIFGRLTPVVFEPDHLGEAPRRRKNAA